MESEKKMDAILAATPWRCFHCDFITTDPEEAAAHFGDRDDAEEFTPICKWWANTSDSDKRQEHQALLRELDGEREHSGKLNMRVEDLEYQVGTHLHSIQSYAPFRKCTSIYEVFCLYDTMEGKALAAAERERELVEAVNQAGFQVMLSDDGKTFIRHVSVGSAVPAKGISA